MVPMERAVGAMLVFLGLVGCGETFTLADGGADASVLPDGEPPLPDAEPPAPDGGECGLPPATREVRIADLRDVDLLFMIDDSGSMAEEQASLAAEIPRLLRVLATGENLVTGESFEPVRSLRVGVVTSDLGSGPEGACASAFGDDGILQSAGVGGDSCASMYPLWLDFASASDDPEGYANDVTCVAGAIGTDGCGYEQPLEAVLKALAPSTSGLTFHGGTRGHGDGVNAGFLHDDALLAIIHLTDEDDCSTSDIDLFDPGSSRYPDPNLNLRCFEYAEALHPLRRYADELLALKRDPGMLVYATISGVPVDLEPDPGSPLAPQVDAILSDERMRERPDPLDPTRLVASCDVPGRGRAFPPRRMVQLASDLEARGARGVVQSICQSDYGGALDAIIAKVVRPRDCGGTLLTLPVDRTGEVQCELHELLDPARSVDCSALPGRTADGVDPATGLRRCRVRQLVIEETTPPTEPAGWYFGFGPDCPGRREISFTAGAEPTLGSITRLSCPVVPDSTDWVGVGSACDSEAVGDDVPTFFNSTYPEGFACADRLCQPVCGDDSDCPTGSRCADMLCVPSC